MEAKAQLRHLRIAPRKVRVAADLIRGKTLKQARAVLEFNLKKSARPLQKLLDSAAANAKNNLQLREDSLVVSKVFVDEGPKLKRWRMRSRGRAAQIQKKTSHITVVLKGEKTGETPKTKAKTEGGKKTESMTAKPAEGPKKSEGTEKTLEKARVRPLRKEGKGKKFKIGGLKKVFRRKSF